MELFKHWFDGKIKLNETEEKIYTACKLLLTNDERDIEINPDDMSYLVTINKSSDYLHINSSKIKISVNGQSMICDFRDKFLDLIKSTIKETTIVDRNLKLDKISKNEINLLDKMIENLSVTDTVSQDIKLLENNG